MRQMQTRKIQVHSDYQTVCVIDTEGTNIYIRTCYIYVTYMLHICNIYEVVHFAYELAVIIYDLYIYGKNM